MNARPALCGSVARGRDPWRDPPALA